MNNPYSQTIAGIMAVLLAVCGYGIYSESFMLAIFSAVLFAAFCLGFTTVKADPVEVGIISFMGQKREYMVTSFTILFLPQLGILDMIRVPTSQVPKDIPLTVAERKTLNIFGIEAEGEVTIRVKPNTSTVERLINHIDSGKLPGFFEAIDLNLLLAVQEAIEQLITEERIDGKDRYRWTKRNGLKISERAREILNRTDDIALTLSGTDIVNFKVNVLKSVNPEVDKADEQRAIEEMQAESELRETQTIMTEAIAIHKTVHGYTDDSLRNTITAAPTIDDCLNQVIKIIAGRTGKIQYVVSNGSLLNVNQINGQQQPQQPPTTP